MLPLDSLLLVALVTAPEGPVDPAFAPLRLLVAATAEELEILDPREVRYQFNRNEEFSTDLNLMRRRYRDLWNAPRTDESYRFPDRDAINHMLSFNRSYRQWIVLQQDVLIHDWWYYQEVLQETDELYRIWDLVRDARCEYYYVTPRRVALQQLKKTIGCPAFYSGQLPPFVPLWRFKHID